MTVQDVLDNIHFTRFRSSEKAVVEAAIISLYEGSETARSILDEIADRAEPLQLIKARRVVDVSSSGEAILVDPSAPLYTVFIDQHGQTIPYDLERMLIKPIAQVITGVSNEISLEDTSGDALRLTNEIMLEMGQTSIMPSLTGSAPSYGLVPGFSYSLGNEFDNVFYGPYANNVLPAGDSSDIMIGSINVSNNITAGGGTDYLHGQNMNDTLNGGRGNDHLFGNAGDDTLIGGAGADSMHGGEGTDTASYRTSTAGVYVNLDNTSLSTNDAKGDTYNSIEVFELSNQSDILVSSGSENYTVFGLNGNDHIITGSGDDWIDGGQGADIMNGGDGIDTVSYQSSTSGLYINLNNTNYSNGSAKGDQYINIEKIELSNHNDTITGSNQSYEVFGMDGNDLFYYFGSGSTLTGGAGQDIFWYDEGQLTITDFEAGEGHTDQIIIDAYRSNIRNYQQLLNASEQVGDNVVINGQITLENTSLEDLHADDFYFNVGWSW